MIILCTMEDEKLCAVCVKKRRMSWGALCGDCEDIVADFTPEEWERIQRLPDIEAARYILSHPNAERIRREYYDAFELCPASEMHLDDCPHCTGNLSGIMER